MHITIHYAVCEKKFSLMNFNRNKQRSSFTDGYLEDIAKLSRFNIDPGYAELVANKRSNISHQILCYGFVLNLRLLCIQFVTRDVIQSSPYLSTVSGFDKCCIADVVPNNFVMESNN